MSIPFWIKDKTIIKTAAVPQSGHISFESIGFFMFFIDLGLEKSNEIKSYVLGEHHDAYSEIILLLRSSIACSMVLFTPLTFHIHII